MVGGIGDRAGGGETPQVTPRRSDGAVTLVLAGAWDNDHAGGADRAMSRAAVTGGSAVNSKKVVLDLAAVTRLDTAGAWLVERTCADVRGQGGKVSLANASASQQTLIEVVAGHARAPEPRQRRGALAMVERIGAATVEIGREARDLVNFFGAVIVMLAGVAVRPWRLRLTALTFQLETAGLAAIPLVGLIAFLIGIVLAFQGVDQLQRFGAEIFTVNLVAIGVLREMGVLLTAILLAGRTGSAFAAEIGTMTANEEVAAMRTVGLDPLEVLVQPRILALLVALPLLTFFADIMGLAGGAVMALLTLDISLSQYLRQLQGAVSASTFWVGIVKAPVFALVIGLVGCFQGLSVSGSAESVGRRTTRAVVVSIFLVLVLDAGFSVLFSVMGV